MKMIINGEKVDASNGAVIDILNPATGEVIDTVPDCTKEDVNRAVEAAVKAQVKWAALSGWQRAEMLTKVVEIARERAKELGELLCRETGKIIGGCLGEAEEFADLLECYIEKYKHTYGTIIENGKEKGTDGNLILTVHEPVGVAGCIVPFNYPIQLYCFKVAPNLLAGNTAVVKPSEYNPLALIKITEIFKEAGIPDGVIQIITGKGADAGAWLTEHPDIKLINFTGSTATGHKVYETGAKHMAKCALELGGNDAFVVCKDADIDLAVDEVIYGRITASGQICISPKRILVQNEIKDAFTEKLVNRFRNLKMGDPMDPSMDIGTLITEQAAQKVEKQVALTVQQGAKIAVGGKRNGAYYEPTVLVDVTRDMDIARDMEVFGPVAPVLGFDTIDEAIDIANQTSYGLGGSVFTADIKTAMMVASRMQTGNVNINASGMFRTHEMAFGGYKNSGIGREGASVSFEEVMQTKNIVLRNVL